MNVHTDATIGGSTSANAMSSDKILSTHEQRNEHSTVHQCSDQLCGFRCSPRASADIKRQIDTPTTPRILPNGTVRNIKDRRRGATCYIPIETITADCKRHALHNDVSTAEQPSNQWHTVANCIPTNKLRCKANRSRKHMTTMLEFHSKAERSAT